MGELKIQNVLTECKKRDLLKIYSVVNSENKLISSRIFIVLNKRIYDILPASNPEGKATGAAFFIIDELIKQRAESDLILDFEGSMIPSIANFYAGWGSVNQPYYSLKINNLYFPLNFLKR